MQRGEAHVVILRRGADGAMLVQIADVHVAMGSLQSVEDLVDLRGGELLVVVAVDHHHRRAAAGREAFFFALQEDAAIRRRLAELDAELLLDMRDDVLGAVEPARDVGADRDTLWRPTGFVSNIE
jgi:hypothetical protein